ncbi:MAG: hypothetical protein P8I43_01905 [Bacteroidia bacterium]|nr:hypothetical protein [Bacteroidia bacterium]
MLTNIQRNIGRRILARTSQADKFERLKKLKYARKIGVVYNMQDMTSEHLHKIIHHFESEGKSVFTLGFVNEKDIDNLLPNYKESYFCNADLNFWKIPHGDSISKFIQEDFDFLINLDLKGAIELQGISTFSVAKTRIGKFFDDFVFAHDLMVKSNSQEAYGLFIDITRYIK